jgi:hypothetical protein
MVRWGANVHNLAQSGKNVFGAAKGNRPWGFVLVKSINLKEGTLM